MKLHSSLLILLVFALEKKLQQTCASKAFLPRVTGVRYLQAQRSPVRYLKQVA